MGLNLSLALRFVPCLERRGEIVQMVVGQAEVIVRDVGVAEHPGAYLAAIQRMFADGLVHLASGLGPLLELDRFQSVGVALLIVGFRGSRQEGQQDSLANGTCRPWRHIDTRKDGW